MSLGVGCGSESFSVIGVRPALRHASDSVLAEPVPGIHHLEIEWSAIYLNQVSVGVHQEYLRKSCQPRSLQYQFLGGDFPDGFHRTLNDANE